MKRIGFIQVTLIYILSVISYDINAQQTFNPSKKITFNGYIKSLQNWQFPDDGNIYSNQLLHNRLNVKWNIHSSLVIAGEWRTRMISGDAMKLQPEFKSMLQNPNDRWDLSVSWVNKPDLIILSNTERLWMSYASNKWYIRAGRQRINWSTVTTWNPNDIFNTYNFLDFDYEERPGCDAIQTRYLINSTSNLEMAWGFAGTKGEILGGIKYLLQIRQWDLQAIIGLYNDHLTLGTSWAGHIKEAGFKGEFQMLRKETIQIYNIASEIDYMFKKGWYGKLGFLYNSAGKKEAIQNRNELMFRMTPLQQMPAAWNMEITIQKEWTPIIKSGATIIYSPVSNMLLIIPTGTLSLSDEWEANLVWQHFFLEEKAWNGVLHNSFIRFRYSF
jgi:hypothetical protein